MSKVNPYPFYSDFDQAWLGDLPSHWQVMRTKLLLDLVTEFAPVGNSEELLSVYTAIGVKPRKELEARGNKASSTDNYWRVQQGDIIVNKLLAWMGAIGISEYNGVTSPAYDILRPKENVNPYYYNFLFRNPIASREFKRHSRGIMDMRLRLYFTRFGDIKLPLPPIEEQDKIVEYLQFKLKKIDRFIHKKKELIKLLNEQKAAFINETVTKGLDPNAKMKSSGIEWLGEIPEHWEVRKLKGIVEVISKGTTPNTIGRNILPDGKILFLKAENIGMNNIMSFNPENYIDEETNLILKRSQLQENDILFVIAGATIGKVAILDKIFTPSNTNQAVSFIRLKDVKMVKFVWYWLQSEFIKQQIWLEAVTSAQPNLAMGKLRNFPLLLPSEKEQTTIVTRIETETAKLYQTISTIEKEIALTQEYRTALIAEAVTGKIDVRNFEIPKYLEEETQEELDEELIISAEELDCDLE